MRPLAIAAILLSAAAAPADEFELTSKEGRFSATFPADPQKSTEVIKLKTGAEITVVKHTANVKAASYNIAWNDYPKPAVAAKPQDVLKGVRDGNIGDGTLGDEKSGTFGPRKLPMREFTFVRAKQHYRNLIVLDDNRLYQVMIVADADAALSDETAAAFYKAFKITAPPAAPGRPREAFASQEGLFSVEFPNEPKQSKAMVPLAGTDQKITVISHVVEVGKSVAFMVAYNDYPEGVLSPDPQDVLQGVRDGNLGPEGKLLVETKGTFGQKKLPIREFTFTKNNIHFRTRIILAGTRLYQVMIVAENEKSLSNDAAKQFIESFKILPKKD